MKKSEKIYLIKQIMDGKIEADYHLRHMLGMGPGMKLKERYYKDQQLLGGGFRIGSREAYKQTKLMFESDPELIRHRFDDCYEIVTKPSRKYKKHEVGCWVWTLKTYDGDPAIIWDKKPNHTKHPRFGLGKLAPPPCNTVYARRYIWNYVHLSQPDWHLTPRRRMGMKNGCHPLCVNPDHMVANTAATFD